MRRSNRLLLTSVLGLTFMQVPGLTWAQTDAVPPVAATRSASGILFSSEVPEEQYSELAQDLAELSSVPITRPDSKLLSIMSLTDAAPGSLLKWLTERVHFIVDQNYNIEPQIISENFEFPEAGIQPVRYGGKDAYNKETEVSVLMGNAGSSFYSIAKSNSILVSMYLPGIGEVTLKSPRAGVLKIGEGLFDDLTIGASKSSEVRNARRTLQLGALFHEARHSDGHGVHLGFPHLICPEEHAFAGKASCDANLNGPYSIEAHFVNSVDRSCDQCSIKEHEILKAAALDLASRVQKEIVDPEKDPIAIVKQTQMLTGICEMSADLGLEQSLPDDLAKNCALLSKFKELSEEIKNGTYRIPVIQSTDWDPTPEGKFDIEMDLKKIQ